ncbi:MAG: DUF4832 domain-containing protein [Vicinamibacterales bacterium]
MTSAVALPGLPSPTGPGQSGTITSAAGFAIAYSASNDSFPNPDRGFYSWSRPGVNNFAAVRAAGFTLVRNYYELDRYRTKDLPQVFLNALVDDFNSARQTGVKLIPRFTYNWGPYPNPDPDASQAQIERHLQQLAPLFHANADVISSFEAGFIGAWGEWHSSTHGLDTDPAAKAAILAALMAAVPPTRMIALRYPSDMQLLNGPPITAAEAFSGTNRARVGSHQDCFLGSADDFGTWGRGGNPMDVDKAYVAENGRFAVVGGETCAVNPPRSLCPTALAELEYMHFSNFDVDYEPDVVQGFRDGGCYDEMDRRLGYRIEMAWGLFPQSTARGQDLSFSLQLRNVGYAAMFNARPVFAVLSNGTERYVTPLAVDPRSWAAGESPTVNGSIALPPTMSPGTYRLALWLPDAYASLQNDPRYAVRFANTGTWDASTGENVIATGLVVTP